MVDFTCPVHGQLSHTEELCPGCLQLECEKIEAMETDADQEARVRERQAQRAEAILVQLDDRINQQRPKGTREIIHQWPNRYWKEHRGRLVGRVLIEGVAHARVILGETHETQWIVLLPWRDEMIHALEREITVHNSGNPFEYWVGEGGFVDQDPESTLQLARRRLLERKKIKERIYKEELQRKRRPLEWEQEQEYERTM